MDTNKDFEAYATRLFGKDYCKKKYESSNWKEEKTDFKWLPLDVVVLDKQHNFLTDPNFIGNRKLGEMTVSMALNDPFEKDLTPIDSTLKESLKTPVFSITKDGITDVMSMTFRTNVPTKKDKVKHTDRLLKSRIEKQSSDCDDSGISLSGEDLTTLQTNEKHCDLECDAEIAQLFKNDVPISKYRKPRRRQKGYLDLMISSREQSPAFTGSSAEANKTNIASLARSRTLYEASACNRSSTPEYKTLKKYQCQLQKLYEYAGVILQDRVSFRKTLCQGHTAVEEQMLSFMEDVITHILKLKKQFLEDFNELHMNNTEIINVQCSRLDKLRRKASITLQSLQVPNDFDDFEKYKDIIYNASSKTVLLQAILKELYKSCVDTKYVYMLELSTDAYALTAIENVAYTHAKVSPPNLRSFLSTQTEENEETQNTMDDDQVKAINVVDDNLDDIQRTCFTGCAFIRNNDGHNVILTDWSRGLLKMINALGIVGDKLEFEHQESPWDVVSVCDWQVAVTVPKLRSVMFVEADPYLHVVDSFKIDCECFGICKIDEKFVMTCDPWSRLPSLRIYSPNGQLLTCFQRDSLGQMLFKCPLYVASDFFNSTIYVSDCGRDCVIAFTLMGDIVFCFKHAELKYPTGIVSDRNNFVCVCGKSSGTIIQITDTGNFQAVLVNRKQGLTAPSAVCVHPNSNYMIFTESDGGNTSGYKQLKIH